MRLFWIRCLFGKHIDGREVSCPFTGLTYIHCSKCDKTFKFRR